MSNNRLLILSISITVSLSACSNSSDISNRPYKFSGTLTESHFSDRLPVISELPLKNIKEPIAYRFWLCCGHNYKVMTITRDKSDKTFAHFCTWHGGTYSVNGFETWQHELSKEEASHFFELIKSKKFWQTNETVTLASENLTTGGARYEIEAKDKTKYKIAFCKREFHLEYKSVYEELANEVFKLVGEPTLYLPR
ncbi:MAG: hypothetical protein IPG59_14855 [Candidatus Melainabacteria bacterium]|nr:MAG: hypothetical protein IPG59_14855 [Candidatus Melainabacteria bacterium]